MKPFFLFVAFFFTCFFAVAQPSKTSIADSIQKLSIKLLSTTLPDEKVFQSHEMLRVAQGKDSVELSLSEYQYDNGARVFMMHTPYQKGKITMKATSWGGYSLYQNPLEKWLISEANLLLSEIGVGALQADEVKFLMKNIADQHFSFQINELTESIEVTFDSQYFELISKLLYQYFSDFSQKNTDKKRKNEIKSIEKYENKSENNAVDSLRCVLENALFQGKKEHDWKIIYEKSKERFGDGGDFTFVFVGDFTPVDNIIGYCNQYYGKLPKDDKGEFCKFNARPLFASKIPFFSKKVRNFDSFIHFEDSISYNAEQQLDLFFMHYLLQKNILRLATHQGELVSGMATPFFDANIIHYPFSKTAINLRWECITDELQQFWMKETEQQIRFLQEKPLSQAAIFSTQQQLLAENHLFKSNPQLLANLVENIMEGLLIEKWIKRADFETYLLTFTPEKIQQLANQFWKEDKKSTFFQKN